MNDHNAHIFTSSAIKVTNRFVHYGMGDISDISLLKLCYKYSCYALSYDIIQKLDQIVSELQIKDNDICIDVSNENFLPGEVGQPTVPPIEVTNTAPTVDNNTVNMNENENYYTFSIEDFTNNFNDIDGHNPGNVVIKSLPVTGLIYDGSPVIVGQIIENTSLLMYDRSSEFNYDDTFNFSIFDDYINGPLESAVKIITIEVEAIDNLPPQIGDNTIYIDNREITILTLEMFTSQLAPPYNDPEGDLIDAIRIDEVSAANQGVYQLNNIDVNAGDIITREDMEAGLFTHSGADIDEVSSDTFSFSARDEGSLIWVQ